MIRLVATDGELTVVRRLAGYAYGQWSVDWPESVPEEQRPKLADDREHGYVHRLGSGSGRMGRRFVRADVSVTAAEYDKNGRVPHTGYSNVEDVLDAAVAQTDEDALVERAITRDGLGVLRPGVDFRVGDLVEVMIWGCAVPLPVTAIEAVTEAGAVVDWRVTVGGQVVSDDVERKRANADLERAVWGERRERLKVAREASEAKAAAAAADRRAGDAQSSADAADQKAVAAGDAAKAADGKADKAQSTADAANGGVQSLRDVLAGKGASAGEVTSQLAELNKQLQEHDEGGSAAVGLIPAYIAANTRRWVLQGEIDRLQDHVSDQNAELARAAQNAADANSLAIKARDDLAKAREEADRAREEERARNDRVRPKFSIAVIGNWMNSPYVTPDKRFRIETDKLGRVVNITALGDWEAVVIALYGKEKALGGDAGTEMKFQLVTSDKRSWSYLPTDLVGVSRITLMIMPNEYVAES